MSAGPAGEKQQLWGLRLREGATCAPQDVIMSDRGAEATKLGVVTSAVDQRGKSFALGYLRCRRKGQPERLEGAQVYVNGEPTKVGCHALGASTPAVLMCAWHLCASCAAVRLALPHLLCFGGRIASAAWMRCGPLTRRG